jgi:hypothetical protein
LILQLLLELAESSPKGAEPIPHTLQDDLVAALGLPGFVQLSVVISYYHMIAGLAIGFEFPLPAGMSDPFR